MQAIRFRGIDSDVVYFDPTRSAPELSTSQSIQTRREDTDNSASNSASGSFTLGRGVLLAITAIVLAALLYVAIQTGGAGSLSFGRAPAKAARGDARGEAGGAADGLSPASLQAILSQTDRRDALVALSNYVLGQLIAAQGVLLQSSWTARDALARIPAEHAHRGDLQDLVLASERVQFGGRDVSEDEFRQHLDRMRPLISGAAT